MRGASDAESGAESINMQQKSLVDMDEDVDSDDSEEVSAIQANKFAKGPLSAVCLQVQCNLALSLCFLLQSFHLMRVATVDSCRPSNNICVIMQEAAASGASTKAGGLLSSFVRNIGVNVMGTQSLSLEDIQPALEQLKKKLMERNVAEEIAAK